VRKKESGTRDVDSSGGGKKKRRWPSRRGGVLFRCLKPVKEEKTSAAEQKKKRKAVLDGLPIKKKRLSSSTFVEVAVHPRHRRKLLAIRLRGGKSGNPLPRERKVSPASRREGGSPYHQKKKRVAPDFPLDLRVTKRKRLPLYYEISLTLQVREET